MSVQRNNTIEPSISATSSMATDSSTGSLTPKPIHSYLPGPERHPNSLEKQPDDTASVKLTKTRSLRDQIIDDYNQTLQEEIEAQNDAELLSRKEFSPEDALSLHLSRTHNHIVTKDETTNNDLENLPLTNELEYPDGGYGWIACFSVFLVMFTTWGNNAAFGVYLSYYIANDTFTGATSTQFAYLAGMIVFFAQIFAPVALIVSSMVGLRMTMSIACVTHFLGYILASFATELWQLFVCQGAIVGISYSFVYVPACAIIPSWFLKKRALASGIVFSGTGLGGITFSLSINALIQRTGDQRWSLRMCAIITTTLISVAIALIKFPRPVQREPITWENTKTSIKVVLLNRKVWAAPQLYSITLWFVVSLLGYNLILFSYATASRSIGLSQHQASVLTAVVNVGQVLGRPSMGFFADRYFGRVNYSIILSIVIIILIFGFWMNATSFPALLICGLLLGYTLGVANVMNSTFIADAFDKTEFAGAWSILNMTIAPLILFVEVIALSLKDDSKKNPFVHTQIFSGCLYVVALVMLLVIREWHVRRILRPRRDKSRTELERLNSSSDDGSEWKFEETAENLRLRIGNYDDMLRNSPIGFVKRVVYPLKV